jgi:hypothetical protein
LDNADVGELILWAVHPKYALYVDRTILESGMTERRIDIQLKKSVPLYGRLVDQTGKPIEGKVVLQEYNGVSNLTEELYPTDANGRFVITNAPAEGKISLSPRGEGLSGDIQVFDLGQNECILKAYRIGRVYGRVVADVTGEPIPEFMVKMMSSGTGARSWGQSVTWQREGYTFRSAEGLFDTGQEGLPFGASYRVTVLAQGFDPLTLDPIAVQTISEDPNRAVFRLRPATTITGMVVDEQDRPIKDAAVALFSWTELFESQYWRQTATNESGLFVISGLANDQNFVYITAQNLAPYYGSRAHLETSDGPPARIVLSVGGRIFGTAVDEEGRPRVGVDLRVYKMHDLDSAEGSAPRSVNKETKTDANGYYEVSSIPPGYLNVSLSDSGWNLGQKKAILASGQSVEINFDDSKGFTVNGLVRRGSSPMPKVCVEVFIISDLSGSYKAIQTDAQGRFRFTGIPTGPTRIIVSGFERQDADSSIKQSTEERSIQVQHNMDLDIDLGN